MASPHRPTGKVMPGGGQNRSTAIAAVMQDEDAG